MVRYNVSVELTLWRPLLPYGYSGYSHKAFCATPGPGHSDSDGLAQNVLQLYPYGNSGRQRVNVKIIEINVTVSSINEHALLAFCPAALSVTRRHHDAGVRQRSTTPLSGRQLITDWCLLHIAHTAALSFTAPDNTLSHWTVQQQTYPQIWDGKLSDDSSEIRNLKQLSYLDQRTTHVTTHIDTLSGMHVCRQWNTALLGNYLYSTALLGKYTTDNQHGHILHC